MSVRTLVALGGRTVASLCISVGLVFKAVGKILTLELGQQLQQAMLALAHQAVSVRRCILFTDRMSGDKEGEDQQ